MNRDLSKYFIVEETDDWSLPVLLVLTIVVGVIALI